MNGPTQIFKYDFKLPKQKTPKALTNYLVVYFDFAYFIFCCPFRFVSSKDGISFTKRKSHVQFTFFILLNSLSIIYYLALLRSRYQNIYFEDERSPTKYFELVHGVFTVVFTTLTLKYFLFHQPLFLKIVDFIQRETVFQHGGKFWVMHFFKNIS